MKTVITVEYPSNVEGVSGLNRRAIELLENDKPQAGQATFFEHRRSCSLRYRPLGRHGIVTRELELGLLSSDQVEKISECIRVVYRKGATGVLGQQISKLQDAVRESVSLTALYADGLDKTTKRLGFSISRGCCAATPADQVDDGGRIDARRADRLCLDLHGYKSIAAIVCTEVLTNAIRGIALCVLPASGAPEQRKAALLEFERHIAIILHSQTTFQSAAGLIFNELQDGAHIPDSN